MNRKNIAKRLKDFRAKKEVTQAQVAEAIGISQSTYAGYENESRVPTDEIKVRLAEYYNTTVLALFF
jgi:transcriptional regulator with XRE-family HTH domain